MPKTIPMKKKINISDQVKILQIMSQATSIVGTMWGKCNMQCGMPHPRHNTCQMSQQISYESILSILSLLITFHLALPSLQMQNWYPHHNAFTQSNGRLPNMEINERNQNKYLAFCKTLINAMHVNVTIDTKQ